MATSSRNIGTVYLVGAGPGDPGLLTLRAQQLLQKAQVVFYDHLVNPQLLQHCTQAKTYYVGKVGYGDQIAQKDIEQKLVQAARRYSVVVRLKGGDPFIFGRGGEEALSLAKHSIPFEVVPGVSSLAAVPAYAGIPLTHRDFGSSVAVITGHGGDQETQVLPQDLDWAALSKMSTLVILMGMKNLPRIVSQLAQAGKSPKTPAAVIEWGTYPKQKTIKCYLNNIVQIVKKYKLKSPCSIVIGTVVSLREQLNWFEARPLFGKQILVTRSRSQMSELSATLSELGAQVLEFPTIELAEPKNWRKVDQALQQIEGYHWILFTSVNGVERFFSRLQKQGQDIRALHRAKLGAVGPATAQALKNLGLQVAKQPRKFTTDDLAKSFTQRELLGKKVLIPRAEKARKEILHLLKEKGAQVEVLPVYRIDRPVYTKKQLSDLFTEKKIDFLTFASSATVQNFYDLLKNTPYLKTALQIPTVVIGPITGQKAKTLGFKKIKMAQEYTLPAVIQALQAAV